MTRGTTSTESVRLALVLVPRGHALAPRDQAQHIKARVNAITAQALLLLGLGPLELSFTVEAFSNLATANSKLINDAVGAAPHPAVRVFYSDKPLSNESIVRYMHLSKLLCVIQETDAGLIINGLEPVIGARMRIPRHRAVRIIEDIFIDICVGGKMVQGTVFDDILKNDNRRAFFFRQKAQFCRERRGLSWLPPISKRAGYATLASLNTCSDDDVLGRAQHSVEAWSGFMAHLAIGGVIDKAGSTTLTGGTASHIVEQLAALPDVGGQLGLQRLRKQLNECASDAYILLLLRRSSQGRLVPVTREAIENIFGKRARLNSTRLYAARESQDNAEVVAKLIRGGFIHAVQFRLEANADGRSMGGGQ